jgi:sarcosine/dimethylglycine N-methyltransferase
MPLPDASFDVVMSQEAWLHVADKPAVIRECARVTKPGGTIAFTDVVVRGGFAPEDEARLAAGMHAHRIGSADGYAELLAANACSVVSRDDLGDEWTRILVERLEMYRSLRDTTVAKFGVARFLDYDAVYSHFVELFVAGTLGGVRFVARRKT